jgi:glycosyltransferase involved in cell wall biosynthesis
LGGTQTVLRAYFEAGGIDRSQWLYALRRVPKELAIASPNVVIDRSTVRFSMGPLLRLRRFIREQGIGVLHCHLFRAQAFGYLVERLFFPGIALVFHEHGRVVGTDGESRLESLAFRILLRWACVRVDCFLCISECAREKLLEVIPSAAARTTVVENPVSAPMARLARYDIDAARREMEIPVGAFVVGFAGRLVERKGWRDFLVAMKLLSARIPIFFLLAGDGIDRDAVRKMVDASGLRNCGRILGHIQQMSGFYQMLDCLAMPSHWEAHGLSHLEAQGYGVPVVVSDVPGLNTTVHVGEDALLFRAGDANALAERIAQVASDPALRTRLSINGVANSARYSVDAFSRRLDAIYDPLCKTRSMTSPVD